MTQQILTKIYNSMLCFYSGPRDLVKAIESRDLEQVSTLYARIADSLSTSAYDDILIAAIRTDNPAIFSVLRPADPNYQITKNHFEMGDAPYSVQRSESLLSIAISDGHTAIATALASDPRINPFISSSEKITPYEPVTGWPAPRGTVSARAEAGADCLTLAKQRSMKKVAAILSAALTAKPKTSAAPLVN